MFNEYNDRPEVKAALLELFSLMLKGKLTPKEKETKKNLRQTLRGMGLLSLPFSLNSKKFKP